MHPIEGHQHLKFGAFDLNLASKIGETMETIGGQDFFEWENQRYPIRKLDSDLLH